MSVDLTTNFNETFTPIKLFPSTRIDCAEVKNELIRLGLVRCQRFLLAV